MDSLEPLAQKLLEAAQGGNHRLVAAAAISIVVWFLRTVAMRPRLDTLPLVGKWFAWLRTDRGGVALTLATGVLGALATAFEAKAPLSFDLILSALLNAVLAGGLFTMSKKAMRPGIKKKLARLSVILPLCLVLLFQGSCATMKGIGIDIAQCSLGVVPAVVADLIPQVEAALRSDAQNWQQLLANIGMTRGFDLLICAVQAVIHRLTPTAQTVSMSGQDLLVLYRAHGYLASIGVRR